MRILHVSDAHCDTGALKRILAGESYDLAVATGDFECLETVEAFLSSAAGRALAVTGNMDHPAVFRRLMEAGALLDGRLESVGGLVFAGVGGLDPATSIRTLRGRLGGSRVDVLLSHHPPMGVLDLTVVGVRAGLDSVRRLVEELRPALHMFGHIHESPGYESQGGTLFVNPGPAYEGRYAVVEVSRGRAEARLYKIK
jgi:Icc-related predicted phosphoesterase